MQTLSFGTFLERHFSLKIIMGKICTNREHILKNRKAYDFCLRSHFRWKTSFWGKQCFIHLLYLLKLFYRTPILGEQVF